MFTSLKSAGALAAVNGRFFLDIEGPGTYWSSSTADNQAYLEQALAAVAAQKVHVGIYTSSSQWGPIMGSTYTGGSAYPLWYADYDNQPVRFPKPRTRNFVWGWKVPRVVAAPLAFVQTGGGLR